MKIEDPRINRYVWSGGPEFDTWSTWPETKQNKRRWRESSQVPWLNHARSTRKFFFHPARSRLIGKRSFSIHPVLFYCTFTRSSEMLGRSRRLFGRAGWKSSGVIARGTWISIFFLKLSRVLHPANADAAGCRKEANFLWRAGAPQGAFTFSPNVLHRCFHRSRFKRPPEEFQDQC